MNEEREKPSVGPLGDMVRGGTVVLSDAAIYAHEITEALEAGHRNWAEACDTSSGFLATLLIDAWNKGRASQDSRLYFLEGNLACIADIVNSMCREWGVEECKTPFADLAIREAIDRLWGKISEDFAKESQ